MNILVTGGSGFIGTNLVRDLLNLHHYVKIFDIKNSNIFPELYIAGDICEKENIADSMKGIDLVYHLAAEHRDDVKPVSKYYDVNEMGAKNLVYAMQKNNVKKLIFTSTVALYQLGASCPDEKSYPKPFNDYGKSKLNAEKIFSEWVNDKKSERQLYLIRPSVIFGTGNRGNVYNLLKMIKDDRFVLVGSGKNKKSMGYVLNISKFLAELSLRDEMGEYVYNYADKPDLSMNQLLQIARSAMNKEATIKIRIPYILGLAGGYFFDLLAEITKKKYPLSSIRIRKFCAETTISTENLKKLKHQPMYSLEKGLRQMIKNEF